MQSDTPPETPEENTSTIVFHSNRGEDPDALGIFLLDIETLEITPIETDFDAAALPRWSPSGEKILFVVTGIWNLYTMNADGSEITQVTDFRSNNGDWSPDGSQIVFQSDQNEPEDTPDIYMMDITGENLVELVDQPEDIEFGPRWSPDGSKIIFISSRTGNFEIFMMNADGTDLVQLTETDYPIILAEWSPDGERIAYIQYKKDNTNDLFIMDKDGSPESVFRLTDDEYLETGPTWSPDGEKIVFRSDRSGNRDLWMINADGTDLVQLTEGEFFDDSPHWLPKALPETEED